ncbi:MocR-like pyridoxine biosynthesis transcription factor PdxR [Streptomyces omiyaensis]|uniref:MocR-like pyridoxine biosynthesis transcription factor PdxR n=1 Tax=Streptomyces omiyaensis TaxID=68247 RepID=UPI0016786CF5|nr:PLP-dependent aminotransferase family protein [Streptomyces omiyaensis]
MTPSGTTSSTTARPSARDADAQPAWEVLLPAASAPARRRGHALQEALREAVRTGRLGAGTRLPSSRALAADLGVSRGLVTEAYEQLTAEGYLRSDRGSGTWVSGAVRTMRAVTSPGVHAPPPPDAYGSEATVDFRPGVPDLSLFPRSAWATAQRAVLAALPHHSLSYPDPRGLPVLRAALAGLLARRRGVVADPDRLVVCSGVAQAATLMGSVLRTRGHAGVGVEDPGSPEHARLFAATGLETMWLPLDDEGLLPASLDAAGVRAVVVTPSHQFPSGIAWSAERRGMLLDWARAVDGYVLEDDYDGDFRYDRAPVGALQGLDPERVVYAGSVSKSLAPGLRLGWMVVPGSLLDEVVERKRTMDLGHPALDQATMAHLVTSGGYDRQLRRCQRVYRERRDALLTALDACFPGTSVTGIAAGLHVIACLPDRYGPTDRFLARAADAGVALRALEEYGTRRPADGNVRLVIGYAHQTPTAIAAGVRRVAEAFDAR